MRRVVLAVGIVLVTSASAPARADSAPLPPLPAPAAASTPASAPAPAPAPTFASAPTPSASGLAVLATSGATDAAWPLARAVYATPSLRPYGVDEAHARVLCGEPAAAGAPADLRDLADAVAGVHGEDGASRAILGDVAHRLNVRALVVVRVHDDRPAARVFLPEGAVFDAATYTPDEGSTDVWTAATRSLARIYGAPQAAGGAGAAAPALATHEEPSIENEPPKPKAFYETGWFWGALGAAAFAGGAIFFATRDNTPTTIHLQMQVPH
jgi:hypothetical protein